jgi:hypothetical protein
MSKIAVFIRCMERKHWGKLPDAMVQLVGEHWEVYEMTEPGGAGCLARLKKEPTYSKLMANIGIAVGLGAEEIWLSVHGPSEECSHVCKGYELGGYRDRFATAADGRSFAIEELAVAARMMMERFPTVAQVRGFYVTFARDGANLIEEVEFEETPQQAALEESAA